MASRASEGRDLNLVDELLFAPNGIELVRFSHAETVAGTTPDFRVLRHAEIVAYCEVKSPRDDWLQDQLAVAPAGQLVGGLPSDPTYNRIARHIEKAATQFDAVNGTHVVPNVLVFVNHADGSHYDDLLETATGMFHAASGQRYVTMVHVSEARLARSKYQIDLYVWVDARSRRTHGYLLNGMFPDNVTRVYELLGIFSQQARAEASMTNRAAETKATSVAECEAALETAYQVYEVGQRAGDSFEHMNIYLGRVLACRDALEEARGSRREPPSEAVIIE